MAMARLAAIAPSVAVVSCGRRDAALADAGARADPLVGRVDELLQVRVGEPALRGVHAPAGDADAPRQAHAGSTSMSVVFALTSVPFSAAMRFTVPVTSLLISLNSFIASMRPMTWPALTWPPP